MALSDWLPWRTSARASAPVDMPRLPGGAPIGRVIGDARVERSDPFAIEANAGRNLVDALRAADSGYLAALNAAIDSALVRDSRLAGVASARILAITSRRWAVRPPAGHEQDRRAVEVAQAITQVFYQTPGFTQRRAELAQGILRPVSVLEHDWQIDANGWRVSRPRHVDPSVIDYDVSAGQWVISTGENRGRALAEFPDKFIVHSPARGLALAKHRRGALRPMLSLSLAKRYGLRWWAEMLERFGQPQVYGIAPEHASEALLDAITLGLRNLSSQWNASFKGDVKLDALPVSINDEAHRKFIDSINIEYAVNLLGGNLATESKDGQVYGSQAQAQVRGDILASDLVELDETIVDQWIEPTVRFNAPGAPVPVIESVISPSRPWSLAEYQGGLCTLDEFRTSNGHDPIGGDAGAEMMRPASAPTSVQVPDAIGALPADASATDVADTALNGAQIASLKEIVIAVAMGEIPRATGVELILAAFPTIDREQAEKIMGPVGAGFQSAQQQPAALTAPPGGAATADPFPRSIAMSSQTSRTPRSGPARLLSQ